VLAVASAPIGAKPPAGGQRAVPNRVGGELAAYGLQASGGLGVRWIQPGDLIQRLHGLIEPRRRRSRSRLA
jgi:hypothetical protein